MNIDSRHSFRTRLIIILSIFTLVNVFNWSVPILETWNLRVYDFLFSLRSHLAEYKPVYNDTIVHVDLDDTSIQQLNNYYLSRAHHAQVVTNLTAMGASIQLHDFLIAAPSNKADDNALIDAVLNSRNAYFGLAFNLSPGLQRKKTDFLSPDVSSYLANSQWQIKTKGPPVDFYQGDKPLITFPPLAKVSKGLGFLNMTPDRDGVFRRVPLLVRYGDTYYPSLAFRVICDYLGVLPVDIVIDSGTSIILSNVRKPGEEEKRDIVIPIDRHGNLTINFIGPWGRMKHYHFSDVWGASNDQDELELWADELSGKIVVVSEVTTGSSDIGSVPTDVAYPLSGINASVIHTILTESFIHEIPQIFIIATGLILLLIICLLSLHSSALIFFFSILMIVILYVLIGIFLFLHEGLILNVINPLIMVLIAFLAIQIVRALENARILRQSEMEKHLFAHELEIGRQIQSGFFPEKLPEIPGWEISAFFRPARQVSGDFYDSFLLANNRLIGIVIADVCDKGVGAALFMALTRSLIRAFASQTILFENQTDTAEPSIGQALKRTILLTNNYIARTHGEANMFATLFIGVLDPDTGVLHYINCGHEPPVILSSDNQTASLKPTGPALGLFPDMEFNTEKVRIKFGDLLFAFTDGVTDAQNDKGELYTKERLKFCLAQGSVSVEGLIQDILQNVERHISSAKQFDDITMMAIKRSYP